MGQNKRKLGFFGMALLSALSLAAVACSGVAQKDYDAVQAQLKAKDQDLASAQASANKAQADVAKEQANSKQLQADLAKEQANSKTLQQQVASKAPTTIVEAGQVQPAPAGRPCRCSVGTACTPARCPAYPPRPRRGSGRSGSPAGRPVAAGCG